KTTWHPGALGVAPHYRLTLTNHTAEPLAGASIGFSGPGRIAADAPVTGGRIVRLLSTYCEIEIDPGTVVAPGGSVDITIGKLDFPIRHWTDGAVTGFVIRADGTAVPALTHPTHNLAAKHPRLRGTAIWPIPDEPPAPLAVIPWPRTVSVSGRRTAPRGLNVRSAEPAAAAFEQLTEMLFPGEGLVRGAEEGG